MKVHVIDTTNTSSHLYIYDLNNLEIVKSTDNGIYFMLKDAVNVLNTFKSTFNNAEERDEAYDRIINHLRDNDSLTIINGDVNE